MAKLSHLVAASFSSFALLSSSVSTANLRCLLVTTFSRLSFLSNNTSLQSFESGQVLFLVVSDDHFFSSCNFLVILLVLSFLRSILSLSFLCSLVSEALFALIFPFLGEHFFLSMLKQL